MYLIAGFLMYLRFEKEFNPCTGRPTCLFPLYVQTRIRSMHKVKIEFKYTHKNPSTLSSMQFKCILPVNELKVLLIFFFFKHLLCYLRFDSNTSSSYMYVNFRYEMLTFFLSLFYYLPLGQTLKCTFLMSTKKSASIVFSFSFWSGIYHPQ